MTNNNSNKNIVVNRRTFLLLLGKLGLLGALSSRLFYLQILQSSKYKMLSEKNRISVIRLIATRGKIFDCHGNVLAYTKQSFQLIANRYLLIKKHRDSLNILFNILDLPDQEKERITSRVFASKYPRNVIIMQDITWSNVAIVEENTSKLPAISVNAIKHRVYSYPFSTSHILGYAAKANDAEKENLGISKHSSQYIQVGKIGVEKSFEEELRGCSGFRRIEVNANGSMVRELDATPAKNGNKLVLSIDINLQNKLYHMFENNSGAAILTEVKTGKIKAFVSAPGYDINAFSKGISNDMWNELVHHPRSPFHNRALNAFYHPSSIFHIVTILAALEAGISPRLSVYCSGSDTHSNTAFNCTIEHGHGNVDMITAIQYSCNSYISHITRLINYNDIVIAAKKLGFWNSTVRHIKGESIGYVPTPEWKKRSSGTSWIFGDTLNIAAGQGYITSTPLQLARMITSIAHGKKLLQLSLTQNDEGEHKPLNIDAEHIDLIRQSLQIPDSMLDEELRLQQSDILHTSISGKSAASKFRTRVNGSGGQKVKINYHGIFVGYTPSDDPKYAVSVVVEYGGQGEYSAAPIGRRILLDATTS